jgi:hypothetical protein
LSMPDFLQYWLQNIARSFKAWPITSKCEQMKYSKFERVPFEKRISPLN